MMMGTGSRRDAEAELNLPPGFRFHPTDEELVVHYLSRKAAHQRIPVPIIAEVDLYKFDPWELPEKALFGQREWYFFTPRDRKYPNGSRPNRAAGRGYWKATGADKPISPPGHGGPLAIKKALVFYQGKAPKGVKTDWIMHEYRLADTNRSAGKKGGSLRLDEWVLCRLYNKKNARGKKMQQMGVVSFDSNDDSRSDSLRTPESDVDHDAFPEFDDLGQSGVVEMASFQLPKMKEENADADWFLDLNLDDLQSATMGFGFGSAPGLDMSMSSQDYYFPSLYSPQPQMRPGQDNMPPF